MTHILKLMNGHIHRNCFLISCSALIFSGAFLLTSWFGWLIFFFLIPIFILAITRQISFALGLLWGLISWSLQLSAILWFLLEHGTGSFLLNITCWTFLIIYLSLHSGIWFYAIQCLNSVNNILISDIMAASITTTYFYWIEFYVFWIFGRLHGYPFSLPLLPLLQYSKLSWIIQRAGVWPTIFCLSLLCISIAHYLVHNKIDKLAMLVFYPFLIFMISSKSIQETAVIPTGIAIIHPVAHESAWDMAEFFLQQCLEVIKKNPKITIIATPESSFPFPLNRYPEFIALWSDYPELQHILFLIGSHRQEEEKLYNSLYYIHQGRIIKHYDKKTTLLFAETVPTPTIWHWGEQLFLKDKQQMSTGITKRPEIRVDDKIFKPYICSDLFFCSKKPKNHTDIFCIVNDSWFSLSYMKQLMKFAAQVKSIAWNCNILYIS